MKKNKGITLIALIITIIIMIILVAVSVSILINSGLIGKAKKAGEDYKTSYEKEQRIGENITIDGVVYNSIDEYIGTLDDGDTEINWEQVIATAQKHPDQQNSEAIGIGTDGNPVNLDLWTYCVINTNEIMMSGGGSGVWGYSNSNIIDGKIQGTVPQYIKVDGENEFYVVTSMNGTFGDCTSLTTAPKIPDTVTDMYQAFANCTSLTTAPALPSSVINLSYTFSSCTSLTTAPVIPSSVTNMTGTFSNCTSLTTAPVIPSSVTDMDSTFFCCTSLTTAPVIPSSVTDMNGTFYYCTNLITAPTIPSSVTEMYYTFQGCSSLTEAPEIPSSVTDMKSTFYECSSLTGDLVINANPTDYSQCLEGAATNSGCNLKLSGTSTMLNDILATKSSNSNISLKN